MKDKLVKHHRSVSYFRMRYFLIITAFVIVAIALVAIPLGITISQMHV